jgi:hypothetical protein
LLTIATESENEEGKVQVKARQVIEWADKTISASQGSSTKFNNSGHLVDEIEPHPSRSLSQSLSQRQEFTVENTSDIQVVISNIEDIKGGLSENNHEPSIVLGNLESVDFYLPKLGVTDAARSRNDDIEINNETRLTLETILRPWQVEFLDSVGVKTPEEFVCNYNEDGTALARSLSRWRQEMKMVPVKTQACSIALHIWSRSCKSAIQSYQRQRAQGVEKPTQPDFLRVSLPAKSCTSTICAASKDEFRSCTSTIGAASEDEFNNDGL